MVNEHTESRAIILKCQGGAAGVREMEEKLVCYFYKWKGEFGLITFREVKVIIKNNALTFLQILIVFKTYPDPAFYSHNNPGKQAGCFVLFLMFI